MRPLAFALGLALVCTSPLGAQDKKPEDKKPAKPAPKTLSLSGCVVRNETAPTQFTLEDKDEGRYRLSGINLRDYVGPRVQIGGALPDSKRLMIKGGLTPNANVAAQAGAWIRRGRRWRRPAARRDRERSIFRSSR